MGYRFRTEGDLLVLQIFVPGRGEWRDATVKDIPTNDPFGPPPAPVFD